MTAPPDCLFYDPSSGQTFLTGPGVEYVPKAAIADARAEVPGWHPIATAPKDGTRVDLWTKRGSYYSDKWERYPDMWFAPSLGVWRNDKGDIRIKADLPTHWMRAPAAPADEGDT